MNAPNEKKICNVYDISYDFFYNSVREQER